MATHIFDIDGTLVHHHTSEWLPGARKMLRELVDKGHQILLITTRGPQDEHTPGSIDETKKLLKDIDFKYDILYGMQSPRVIHDDIPPKVDHHKRDSPW